VYQAVWAAPPPAGQFSGLTSIEGDGVLDYLGNSLQVAVAAALVCAVLALPVARLISRHRGWVPAGVGGLAQAGYAIPGVVMALVLIGLVQGVLGFLAGTVVLVVIAQAARFLPEAIQASRGALDRVPAGLEESAVALGHRRSGAFARVSLPLAGAGVVAGALLVFLSTIKEVPATLLLRPVGFDTLAVRIWLDASEGIYPSIAVPALVLFACCAAALGGAALLVRGRLTL
jgi:iron(III) transport system permease protein